MFVEFLGHPVAYWIELHRKAEELNLVKLLDENASLRAKVSFYESRIGEMNQFKDRVDSK